jgi:hypothetical protein
MNNDLISRNDLKEKLNEIFDTVEVVLFNDVISIIDNAPTIKPCDNCDLYFKAMTKEEMRKGGAE